MNIQQAVNQTMNEIEPYMLNYPWDNNEAYVGWLSQQYHIVRHSTPMLALCCGRAINNPDFHKRCIDHLSEEKGHDKMLLNDIKLSKGMLHDEEPTARGYYSPQYYQIEHNAPESFLGYILFMEALAVRFGKKIAQKAANASKGTTFLKLHAEEDDGHIDSAYKIIENLPDGLQTEIINNLRMSAKSYTTMMVDLAKYCKVVAA